MIILLFLIIAIVCITKSSSAKDSDNADFLQAFAAVFLGAAVLRFIF